MKENIDSIKPQDILKYKMMLECFKSCTPLNFNINELNDTDSEIIRKYFTTAISDLMNDIEYFSMNFTTGIASECDVYTALHTTYLSAVGQLYYFIASKNTNQSDKFYTHTIDLFNKWKSRVLETKKKENQVNKKYQIKQGAIDL